MRSPKIVLAAFLSVICALAALIPASLNAAVDLTPPSFSRLVVSPSLVDVTNGPGEVEVEIDIVDDVSGFSSGSILIQFENVRLKWFFNNSLLVTGLPTGGTYRIPVTIPAGAPAGQWSFGAQIWDAAGRVTQEFPDGSSLTVINNGPADAEPPTIHEIRFKDEVLDISNGGGVVEMEFDISDDVSGISHFRFDLVPEQADVAVDTRLFVYYNVTEGSERKTIKANYPLGPYAPAGIWRIDLLALEDRVRRLNHYEWEPEQFAAAHTTTIEIINSNSDLIKPQLTGFAFKNTSPDISFADALVPFSLNFADLGSGIETILIELHPPSGGRELTYYRKNPELKSGTVNEGTIEGYFEIPRFSEFGTYNLKIRLRDLAGNFIDFGHGAPNPLPAGISSTLTVTNTGGVDQTDLVITGFRYSPTPIDVTDSYQWVDLFIDFTDDVSGLDNISFRIKSPDEEFSTSYSFDTDDLVAGDAFNGTAKIRIQIPQFSEPGDWKITSLTTLDAAGNYFSKFSYPVFTDDSPSFLEVVNNGPVDLDGPELVEVSLESEVIDVTDSTKWINARLTATDAVSGVDSAVLTYTSPSSNHRNLFLFAGEFDIESAAGDSVTFADTILVRQFVAPGDFLLSSIEVEDKLGRETVYKDGGENPIPAGVPRKITVVNNGSVDEEDPVITAIRLSEKTFDITDFSNYFEVEIDYTDDVSGVDSLSVKLDVPNTFFDYEIYYGGNFEIVSGDRRAGTLRATARIPQFIAPDTYRIIYDLEDQVDRSTVTSNHDDDFPSPDAGTITLTNNGPVDLEHPRITDLSIDEVVDVSDESGVAQATLSITDDVAGIEYVNLRVTSPSGAERITINLKPVDLISGTATEGTFVFPVEFPAFLEAGVWNLVVLMRDNVGNFIWFDPEDLGGIGLTSTISVTNDKPANYLWKGSAAYPDGWRYLEWFGWAQDQDSYPYVYHTQHGWVYTSGSDLSAFAMYDVTAGIWWFINEDWYPYMYANTSPPKWVYYYAPYGSPGNRWFYDFSDGQDKREADL